MQIHMGCTNRAPIEKSLSLFQITFHDELEWIGFFGWYIYLIFHREIFDDKNSCKFGSWLIEGSDVE